MSCAKRGRAVWERRTSVRPRLTDNNASLVEHFGVARPDGFRILTEEEFASLTTQERIEYLRDAIAALDEMKAVIMRQIMADTAEALVDHARQLE